MKKLFLAAALLILAGTFLFAQETEVQFLSGHGKDDAVPWKFFCTAGANSGVWTNLPVPSQWDVKGFGTLNYKKDLTNAWNPRGLFEYQQWKLKNSGALNYLKDATNAYPEHGLYVHDFFVSNNWSGRRIFLVFDGVMTDTDARLNGKSAGPVHQGAFYRFKYEVTPLVKFGATNLLEVEVAKHSANKSIDNAERLADYWVFGGIYRPVYLEAVPQEFIARVAVNGKADGKFSVDVFVGGVTNGAAIEAQIKTLAGENVGQPFSGKISRGKATLTTQIDSPKLWTAETPNLYSVQVSLKQGAETIHEISQRFGFRTFEVRDGDGLYLNGQRVILKGADRHSFWPDSGRTLSTAVQKLDIETMKDANMNAVRMSHYPPDAEFLDLCDELGLYVLDELTGWHHFYDNKVGPKLVQEMVVRDVNHPSILFWDNGNEGGFNTHFDKIFGNYDPQARRVLHPWAPFSGMNTVHYLPYKYLDFASNGVPLSYRKNDYFADTNSTKKLIYMPTEFMHGLFDGGAGAGFADVWGQMTKSKLLGGGFIWALLDDGVKRPGTNSVDDASAQPPHKTTLHASNLARGQSVLKAKPAGKAKAKADDSGDTDETADQTPQPSRKGKRHDTKDIIDVAGNQAPDGIVGPYRQREASFYAIKQIWSPIQILETNLQDNFDGKLTVENHFSFTDANQCQFEWQLRKFPSPSSTNAGFEILDEGKISPQSIPPGGKGPLQLDLPSGPSEADALALRVSDPAGRELWTWVWPAPHANDFIPDSQNASEMPPASATETDHAIVIKASDLTVKINKETGLLAGVSRGSQVFSLANGPRLALGKNGRLAELTCAQDDSDYVVTAKYLKLYGDLQQVTWRVSASGWLQCDYTYAASGTNDFFGVTFDYPEKLVKSKRWLGDGPYRVWKNRPEGVTLGVWQNAYNKTITGYHDWIYPEFKGVFADVSWLQLKTTEGLITVVPQKASYVQMLTPDFPPAKIAGNTIAPLPKCGLGFLDAIPPMGSKFQRADAVSPSGQRAVAHGEYSGSVGFYFGNLTANIAN